MKRPASAEEGPRKRPASSINQTVREIKEQSAAMSETRDKGKGEKFAKMLKAGTLPPEVELEDPTIEYKGRVQFPPSRKDLRRLALRCSCS